jgi:hypothetical protein
MATSPLALKAKDLITHEISTYGENTQLFRKIVLEECYYDEAAQTITIRISGLIPMTNTETFKSHLDNAFGAGNYFASIESDLSFVIRIPDSVGRPITAGNMSAVNAEQQQQQGSTCNITTSPTMTKCTLYGGGAGGDTCAQISGGLKKKSKLYAWCCCGFKSVAILSTGIALAGIITRTVLYFSDTLRTEDSFTAHSL